MTLLQKNVPIFLCQAEQKYLDKTLNNIFDIDTKYFGRPEYKTENCIWVFYVKRLLGCLYVHTVLQLLQRSKIGDPSVFTML